MNKKVVLSQLKDVSQKIESSQGIELDTILIGVCAGLVNLVAEDMPVTVAGSSSMTDVIDNIMYLDNSLCKLSRKVGDCECITKISESAKIIDEESKIYLDLIKREESIEAEREEIDQAKVKLIVLTDDYETAKMTNEALQSEINKIPESMIEELKKRNENLESELTDLESTKKSMEENIERHKADIEKVKEEKNSLSEEEQEYLAELETKRNLLSEAREYNEDNYITLKNENATLRDDIERYKANIEATKETINILRPEKETLINDFGVVKTEFVDNLLKKMSELKELMNEKVNELNEIKDHAEAIKKGIDECNEIREKYSFMVDTDRVFIDAVAKASKMPDSELSKYYDITRSEYVQELIKAIEDKIDELDSIIYECNKAASVDQRDLNEKAVNKT